MKALQKMSLCFVMLSSLAFAGCGGQASQPAEQKPAETSSTRTSSSTTGDADQPEYGRTKYNRSGLG